MCLRLSPLLRFWGNALSAGHIVGQFLRTRLIVLLVVLTVVRIGEASNPGPEDAMFILGIANPSGLRFASQSSFCCFTDGLWGYVGLQ